MIENNNVFVFKNNELLNLSRFTNILNVCLELIYNN